MTTESEDQPLLLNHRKVNRQLSASSQDTAKRFRRYFVFTGILFSLLLISLFVALAINQGNINYVQQIHKYFANKNLYNLLNKEGLPKNAPLGCAATVLILPHCGTYFTEIGTFSHIFFKFHIFDSQDWIGCTFIEANIISHSLIHRLEDSCNDLGMERSFYLITQFGSGQHRWPIPFHIISLVPKSSAETFRAIETAAPIQQYFKNEGNNDTVPTLYNNIKSMVQQVAHDLLQGILCGQLVVIIPNDNSDISNIAFEFGCSDCPPFWSGDYDEAWELHFLYNSTNDSDSWSNHNSTTDTEKQMSSSAASFRLDYASVRERFDALQFSKSVGDYTPNAIVGEIPNWMNMSIYNGN